MFDVRRTNCSNCAQGGHTFRYCMMPITSYGIIAIRQGRGGVHTRGPPGLPVPVAGVEFLLIRRRDSLSFIEFVRGKYSVTDRVYLKMLLQGMSQPEQEKLRTQTFDQLWRGVWGEAAGSHRTDYDVAERKYREIAPTREAMGALLTENPSPWPEPEWGFPKGRRNPYESELSGAIREFQEETSMTRGDFKVFQNVEPLVETFFGSNGVQYCHKYFLAACKPQQAVGMDTDNHHMAREIGDIGWFPMEQALQKIRPESVEKRELVLRVGRILRNFSAIEI
jgi:8-oxo-dGTP pyrophosphatase MutT (NUDIX family)